MSRIGRTGTIAGAISVLFVATLVAIAQAADDQDSLAVDEATPFMEPRLVGGPGAAPVNVLAATARGDDLVYLGGRGREHVGLRWIDGLTEKDRRLAEVRVGDFEHQVETLGDGVIFSGRSVAKGVEPWSSDGTRSGTRMLKNVARGQASDSCVSDTDCGTHAADSDPGTFVTLGDAVYFYASDQATGRELWRTDGTRTGTRLVADIAPGKRSSIAGRALAAVDGDIYFVADDGRHGAELWRSDGTRAGTQMIRDIGPGPSLQSRAAPVATAGHVYFVARTADEGFELWRTDGSAEDTLLVSDIRPGPASSKPEDLIAVGDRLFFTAMDGEHGRELWQTDGTEAGTRPFGPGQEGARQRLRRFWAESPSTVGVGGRLFFPADDGLHGVELWSTDGTPAGTELVRDIRPGAEGSDPEWLVAAEGYLYFTADDGEQGRQVWQLAVSNG